MIKHFRIWVVALAALGFVACQKEKSLDSTEEGGTGLLRMKIDGRQWAANKIVSATIMNGFIGIIGSSTDNKDIIIRVEATSTGTYQLDQQSLHVAAINDNNESAPISYTTNQGQNAGDAGGVVTITKIDEANKRISGTFSFKVYREIDNKQLTITEGVFENIPYTTELPPTGGTGNELKVKINGADWTGKNVTGIAMQGNIMINATELDVSKTVGLVLPQTITAGTYQFDGLGATVMGMYIAGNNPATAITYVSETGSLTITEHNTGSKTIKGTFNFEGEDVTGANKASLTSGSFTVKYQ